MASPEIQGIITIPTQLEEQIKSRLSAYFKKYRYKTKKGREKEKVEGEREREGRFSCMIFQSLGHSSAE